MRCTIQSLGALASLAAIAAVAILLLPSTSGASGEEMAGDTPAESAVEAPAAEGVAAEVESGGETAAPATETPAAAPAATPAEPAGEPAGEAGEAAAAGRVALARFTTAIENREPVDAVSFLENDARSITFYTDLRGLAGQTVTHRWEYGGQVMAEVPFAVGGDRWRVWSSKKLMPEWTGDWTVNVTKGDGEVIASESFTYQPAP